MSAEPLNVRVARVLHPEWKIFQATEPTWLCDEWGDYGPTAEVGEWICIRSKCGAAYAVPPFGEETPEGWAVTGALMCHVRELSYSESRAKATRSNLAWYAGGRLLSDGFGATWGEALCNLVLALSAAGRLGEVRG